MYIQAVKLIFAVVHDFGNFPECSIRCPAAILIDFAGQYDTNRSCDRHFIGIIQTIIVFIIPDRTANHALVLLFQSGIIMPDMLAACQIYGNHGTICVRHFPY